VKPAKGAADISLHREIPSRLREVDGVCREIRSLLEGHGLEGSCYPVELVTREFLNNAIIHGNHQEEDKKVGLDLRVGRKWILLRIVDEGTGFNWRKARRMPPPEDTATSGRGLYLGGLYGQRMAFNRRGNRVKVWLKREDIGGSDGRLHD